jgi:regulator of sigma E protease
MTAPAAAPSSAPIAPTAPRAPPPPPADRLAFAAVLDSFPDAARAGAATGQKQPHPSDESQQESPPGQPPSHSLLSDGALLASLPFALHAALATDAIPENSDQASSLAPAGPGPKDSRAAIAASAGAPTVGRLIGERAFHFGASAIASRGLALDGPFGAAEAKSAPPLADAAPASDGASAPAQTSIVPRAVGASITRVSPTQAAAHDAARSGRRPEAAASPPIARAASSTAPPAPAGSSGSGKAAGNRPPDPIGSVVSPAAQADLLGAQPSAPFALTLSFEPDASMASAAAADMAPRANALGPSATPSAPPVREIDVDLSPGGLEDVSMTMRLANDKLSVVVRAGSTQTLSSIEGARDAIADRLAAIGQPLDSLIVRQTGVNSNANANGDAASAGDGSAGRSAQGAGERGDSNDALSRRGAGRDRGF